MKKRKATKYNQRSKNLLVEKIEWKEKSVKIALLEDNVNNILDVFEMNFTNKGINNFLKNLP